MKETIESQFCEKAKLCNTAQEYSELCDAVAADIVLTDDAMYSVTRERAGYGSYRWRISFANEYYFGNHIAKLMRLCPSILTHDECQVFSIEDFREEIANRLWIWEACFKDEEDWPSKINWNN